MKCMYCGQDNPDGAVYCVCGHPLALGNAFGVQTVDFPVPKRKKRLPVMPIILLLLVALGVGGFFYYQKYMQASLTDESKWGTISGSGYTVKAPKILKKGTMLTGLNNETELLDFYTSEEVGFDVSVYRYTDEEKLTLGKMDAAKYLSAVTANGRTVKINGQELKYKVREDENYLYAGVNRHCMNNIGKTDDVYYIEAMFPCSDCYYEVNVYCAEEDRDKYEDSMLKLLDSFTPES